VNCVEICNVCARKVIIKAAKEIINSDKMCHSYSDLNFGITFLEHNVVCPYCLPRMRRSNAFGHICLSVCLSVCNALTVENIGL